MLSFIRRTHFKTVVRSAVLICAGAWGYFNKGYIKERTAQHFTFVSHHLVKEHSFPPLCFFYHKHIQSQSLTKVHGSFSKQELFNPCAIVLNGLIEKNFFDPQRATCIGILCESTVSNEHQEKLIKDGMKVKKIPSSKVLSITYKNNGRSFMSRLKIRSLLKEYNKKLIPKTGVFKQKVKKDLVIPMMWVVKQSKECVAFVPCPESESNFLLPEIFVDIPLYLAQTLLENNAGANKKREAESKKKKNKGTN